MKYKIIDLQGSEHFEGLTFNSLAEVHGALTQFHGQDFKDVMETDQTIEEYEKGLISQQVDPLIWLLDYGQWDLEEIN